MYYIAIDLNEHRYTLCTEPASSLSKRQEYQRASIISFDCLRINATQPLHSTQTFCVATTPVVAITVMNLSGFNELGDIRGKTYSMSKAPTRIYMQGKPDSPVINFCQTSLASYDNYLTSVTCPVLRFSFCFCSFHLHNGAICTTL